MEYSNLLWLSGNDIPFPEAAITVHSPTIKEIGYIGEDEFFLGCNLLNFNKEEFLSGQDKVDLEQATNFQILMSVLNEKSVAEIQQGKNSVLMVLTLLFPNYRIQLTQEAIILIDDAQGQNYSINNDNYEIFKNIIVSLFCLKPTEATYNPKGSLAKKIAEKLEAGRRKAAKQSGQNNKKITILSNYVSILAVGEHKDMNQLMNYSIYQLYDEFERFQLKQSFDMHMQASMAGAKMESEPENWLEDIHDPDRKRKK